MNNRIDNYNDIPAEINFEDDFRNIFKKIKYTNKTIIITGKSYTGKQP